MDIYKNEDIYAVEDYCFERHDDFLLGVIKKDFEGYWVFAPARKAKLTCRQLRDLSKEISRLNIDLRD